MTQSLRDPRKDKVQRVLHFLRDLHQLRTRLVRDHLEHEWSYRLDDLPHEPEVACTFGRADEPFRLEVQRVVVDPCPDPPPALRPRLSAGWDDPNLGVHLEPVDGIEPHDAPAEWVAWLERRAEWAEVARRQVPVQRLFRKLYDLWLKLEREAESWDLVLADGLLEAPGDDGPPVRHPILQQRLELSYDDRGVLVLQEGDGAARLHSGILRAAQGFSSPGLRPLQQQLDADLRINDRAAVERVVQLAVTTVFPQTGRFGGPAIAGGAHLQLAPMFLLVRRTPGVPEAIDRFLHALPQLPDLPVGLRRVVGEHADRPDDVHRPRAAELEVLLTKEANADQEEIVRRLESSGAVLVQGPPGTGKTHTIANLIGHLLAHGNTVLVTSHTTKALRVVRDKVVPELQPLCVGVLERDTDARRELEASIGGIVAEFNRATPAALDKQIVSLRERRRVLLERIDGLDGRIRRACADRLAPLVVSGVSTSLQDAAEWLQRNAGASGWIPGALDRPEPLPLDSAQIDRLYALLAETTPEERRKLGEPLPDPAAFPTPDALARVVAMDRALQQGKLDAALQRDLDIAAVDRFRHALDSLATAAHGRLQEQVVEDAIAGRGRLEAWTELADQIATLYRRVGDLTPEVARWRPELVGRGNLQMLAAAASQMARHRSGGGNFGFFSMVGAGDWKAVLEKTRVVGRAPDSAAELEFLSRWLGYKLEEEAVVARWTAMVGPHGGPSVQDAPGRVVDALWTWRQDLDEAIRWATKDWAAVCVLGAQAGVDLARIEASTRAPDPARPARSRRLAALTAASEQSAERRLAIGRKRVFDQRATWTERARAAIGADSAGFGRRLLRLLDVGDVEAYRRELGQLHAQRGRRQVVVEIEALLAGLRRAAPEWAVQLEARTPPHHRPAPPGDVANSVHWKRLQQAFDARVAVDPAADQRKLGEARDELRKVTAAYVRAKAWRHQRDRVTSDRHQALVGWVDTVKKIGKGTGKQAPRLLAEARTLLQRCRDAVPVWIMPLSRALESYDLSQSRFDVVIVDEASQMDVSGIVALALGMRVIVVGDHEQVSPSAVGERVDQLESLQRQHLVGIPNAHLYDGKTSIYDLARQSFGGEGIRLREHFRCARRIISFSNTLCYDGEIVPLRDTSDVPRVPSLVGVAVSGIKAEQGTNLAEARMAAALIVAMMERAEYRGCTFGAISLVGDAQALLIDQLLAERVTPEERLRRRLLCGSAPQFQGDERHVMVVSMVDGPPEDDGPLWMNDRADFKQRLNVAASRAQDQMWVVHSVEPSVHLKPGDLRRRFLDHVYTSDAEDAENQAALDRTESPFERAVLSRLLAAGFDTIPQWEVGAYRIDLVVQGEGGRRLAVECDGERFHPVEQVADDLARQAMLERLGWVFHRIRGASWYRDPERAWERLVQALHDRGIEPRGPSVKPSVRASLADTVLQRARQLIEDWASPGTSEPAPAPTPVGTRGVKGQPPEVEMVTRSAERAIHAEVEHEPERAEAPAPVQPAPASEPRRSAPAPNSAQERPKAVRAPSGSRKPREAPTAPPEPRKATVAAGDPVKAALVELDPALASAPCPTCNRAMTLFVGRHGPFVKCTDAACDGRAVVAVATLTRALELHPEWTCGTCGEPLQVKAISKGARVRCSAGHEETWKDLRDRLK